MNYWDDSPDRPLFCVIITIMTAFDPIPLNLNESRADSKNGEPLHLFQTFDLDPIGEICLRFFLHIDSAPDGAVVKMNRWRVGITQTGQSFIADVTDYVTLEDNVLFLQLNQPGALGAIWLERIPCEVQI
jgi:hypothetical protein